MTMKCIFKNGSCDKDTYLDNDLCFEHYCELLDIMITQMISGVKVSKKRKQYGRLVPAK